MVTTLTAAVLSCVGGRYGLFAAGETMTGTIRGRIKRPSEDRILVGDQVTIAKHADGSVTIEEILPRRSVLRRRSPGRSGGFRPVAANVDQVVVVGAAARPDWEPSLIDRFIAVAEASGLPSIIVLNKIDLRPESPNVLDCYRRVGYRTLVTSAAQGTGIAELATVLAGNVSLFTGTTGVGKSSLLNQLQPGLGARTGDVGERAGLGRHTTVSAEMHPFREGGFLVDTPGLRDVGLWGVTPSDVAAAFPEISRLAGECHFDDCRHVSEPHCAVLKAASLNQLDPQRLSSYHKLLEESARTARTSR